VVCPFCFFKEVILMQLFGVSLGEGIKKVGEVFTFSLPSHITCPGMSIWCKKHCYAYRYERRRPKCQKAYQNNFALTQNIDNFITTMIGILPRIMPCFRIHISGDFYSIEYIEAWQKICSAFPQTKFWTYSRSWNVSELLPSLNTLRTLPNVQIFASTDPTIRLPPEDWRIAFIETDLRANGLICLAQTKEKHSCLQCGYCFNQKDVNIIFKVH